MLSFTKPLTMANLFPTIHLIPPLNWKERGREELHGNHVRTRRHPAPSRASPAWKGGVGDPTSTPIRVMTLHQGVDLKLKFGVKNNRIGYHPTYLHYHQLL